MRLARSLGAREGVDAVDPGGEAWARPAVALAVAQDQVEELVVLRLVERRVLEERGRADVGSGELVADQVVARREHALEAVERFAHLRLELGYPSSVGLRPA